MHRPYMYEAIQTLKLKSRISLTNVGTMQNVGEARIPVVDRTDWHVLKVELLHILGHRTIDYCKYLQKEDKKAS